jgi:hypothetical protein
MVTFAPPAQAKRLMVLPPPQPKPNRLFSENRVYP